MPVEKCYYKWLEQKKDTGKFVEYALKGKTCSSCAGFDEKCKDYISKSWYEFMQHRFDGITKRVL